MKVLITGATGFIGNHLVNYLIKNHPTLVLVASSTSEVKAKNFDWYNKVEYKPFDISTVMSNQSNFYNYFGCPDKLIHLAWEGLPNYKSLFHFEKNLPLHYTFLKKLINEGLRDLTVSGTCAEYGMKEGKLKEEMVTNPVHSYGIAKDALRRFLEQLRLQQEFNFKWVRLFYLHGKGQAINSITSQLDKAVQNGDKVFNMSAGQQWRDYLTVESVAEIVAKVAMQNEVVGIINCSSGKPISVKKFVLEYLKRENVNIKLNLGYYPYPDYEPMRFWGDNGKLSSIIEKRE